MKITIILEKSEGNRKEIEVFNLQSVKAVRKGLVRLFKVAEDEFPRYLHEKD